MEEKYHYPYNPRILALLTKIIYGRGSAIDFEEISKNFVVADDTLLESNVKYMFDDSVAFLSSKDIYVARKTGFVYFNNNEIKIFPIVGVNEEKLFSYIVVPSIKSTKNIVTPRILREEIKQYNFKDSISASFLKDAIELFRKRGGCKIINEGTVMIPNRVDDILFDKRFNFNTEDFYYVGGKRQLSINEISFFTPVEKGDHLGIFKHFIEGKEGEDIFGYPIEKKTVNSYYTLGEGIEKDATDDLHAEISGVLSIRLDGRVVVRKAQILDKDVKKNIYLDSDEDLIIVGNVYPSVEIKVKGNLIILNSVEGIKIDCGGDLLIAGGINNKCTVSVNKSCVAQFVANSSLRGRENLFISQYIHNSKVRVKEDIIVRNNQLGEIVGGIIDTEEGNIETNTVGSISGIATNLMVSTEAKLSKTKNLKTISDQLIKEKILIETSIQRVKPRVMLTYEKYKRNPENFTQIESANFKKNLLLFKQLRKDLKQKNKEIEEIQKAKSDENKAKPNDIIKYGNQIRVYNEIYGGVNVQIKNIRFSFKENSYRPYLLYKHPILPKIESLYLKEDNVNEFDQD